MLVFAAISGFVFVALGAFGAHVLSGTLGANEMAGSAPGWNIRDSTPRPSGAGGRDAAPREPVVLLERSAVGVRHRVVQRQPLLPALSHLKVWLYHAGWRRVLPDRLDIDVDWRFASEEKGRAP